MWQALTVGFGRLTLRLPRSTVQKNKDTVLVVLHPAEDEQKLYAKKLEEEVGERTAELSRLSHETRQILEAASDGIIGIDIEGRVTFANPTAAEILDRDVHALKGMSVDGAFVLGTGSADPGASLPLRVWPEKNRLFS